MKEVIIAYDKTLMRPACALLQVMYGGDSGIAQEFDVEDWLLAPTPNLRPYRVPLNQLGEVVEMTRQKRKAKRKRKTKAK